MVAVLGLAACAAPGPAPSPPPEGDGPLVAFYGDSYTLGTGASDPSLRWSTLVSEERGWREFNPSVNGLGFVNQRDGRTDDLVDLIVEQQPDIVIVTMGLNDAFSMDGAAERIRSAIDDDFDRFRDELPEARLIVSEPFWYLEEATPESRQVAAWVAESADRVGAERMEGAATWLEGGSDEMMAADGLHPSDTGYKKIAEIMDEGLRELGL
ncbi:SGNH/GDSL hydrolase family protein [Arenivirga flava]|uniref:SGNH/GDSL hydrolase family protein n=1 Tax=Arenivirga flava TaxID=1930060 RepID=UPI0024E1057E|nr:SGNH/GDSL hydrolase family protein [Arenivirga flava]